MAGYKVLVVNSCWPRLISHTSCQRGPSTFWYLSSSFTTRPLINQTSWPSAISSFSYMAINFSRLTAWLTKGNLGGVCRSAFKTSLSSLTRVSLVMGGFGFWACRLKFDRSTHDDCCAGSRKVVMAAPEMS